MSQLEIVMDQVKLLPPSDLIKLIRQAAEILEQKHNALRQPKTNYLDFLGAGKGVFNSPEEVDRFIRAERDAWDE